jgi:hypothetical protein
LGAVSIAFLTPPKLWMATKIGVDKGVLTGKCGLDQQPPERYDLLDRYGSFARIKDGRKL